MTITPIRPDRELNQWERTLLSQFRETCSDHPDALADIDVMETTWRTLPAPTECPNWCEANPGHSWTEDVQTESSDVLLPTARTHYHRFGGDLFEVSQTEYAHTDGTVTVGPPDVRLDLGDYTIREPITETAKVVDLSTAALEAARLLQAILDGRVWHGTVSSS